MLLQEHQRFRPGIHHYLLSHRHCPGSGFAEIFDIPETVQACTRSTVRPLDPGWRVSATAASI